MASFPAVFQTPKQNARRGIASIFQWSKTQLMGKSFNNTSLFFEVSLLGQHCKYNNDFRTKRNDRSNCWKQGSVNANKVKNHSRSFLFFLEVIAISTWPLVQRFLSHGRIRETTRQVFCWVTWQTSSDPLRESLTGFLACFCPCIYQLIL